MKKIFLIAIAIRLICLYLFRNVLNYDLQSYLQVGELTLKGINIYPEIASLHHPYLPFFLYVEAFAFYLGRLGGLGMLRVIIIIKFINTIFDLGIVYLVYLLSQKNLKTTFLYAINPVTILITTLHGQFDVIPIFFVLLTIRLINKRKELYSILSFSFAILTKTWPVIFFIPIARKIRDKKSLVLIAAFPILFCLFYIWIFDSSLINIGKTVFSYRGLWRIWGVWGLLGKLRLRWQILSTVIFLVGFVSYSWLIKEKNIVKDILKLLFFFFVFTTNFSIQYFVWFIPFLILVKPENYLALIILIAVYLFSFYYFWLFCVTCRIAPNWLTAVQNITGFILWLSFIKVGYLSRKIS